MSDKRDGVSKRPVRTVGNGSPKSKPTSPGAGKGGVGRPESQRPAPRGRMVDD
ncbi:hypothetical protein [Pseudomonas plecoglossicida]|uniref:hypothetical protein n=1 Tax=Pseudomonas plecoglossicida TaxID=70775 RepID=UPI000A70809C|nr:hypothetical protein [Pseudomonas plecoglossicida]